MPIPFREFTVFDLATLIGHDLVDYGFDDAIDWTTTHKEDEMIFGAYLVAGWPDTEAWYWRSIVRPPGASFALLPGADEFYDWGIRFYASIKVHAGGATPNFWLEGRTFTAPNPWDPDTVTGRDYDGSNDWPAYPSPGGSNTMYDFAVLEADLPKFFEIWNASYAADGYYGNSYQDEFLRNGVLLYASNWGGGGWPLLGEHIEYEAEPAWIRARVMNAVFNSITPATTLPGTTPAVVLAGMGFNNSDADITDVSKHPNNVIPPGGWNDHVEYIYIRNVLNPSVIVATLYRGLGEFTVDTNEQITIPVMPLLPEGTYWIQVKKEDPGLIGVDVYSYAGDWRADAIGRMTVGARLTYKVEKAVVVKKKKIVIVTRWKIKKFDGTIAYRYYAPIDTRGPGTFYEGRIISLSSFSRGLNDISGLAEVSDVSMELANQDKEFSKLLAEYHVKDQPVEVFMAWAEDPETIKSAVAKFVVDDYERPGLTWKVKLKDVTQKYMKRRLPTELCTETEYPDIWPDHIGKGKPVCIGFCQHTIGEAPGAIEAIYIGTAPSSGGYQYLASMDTINIVGVYSDGAGPMAAGLWSQAYGPDGETYLYMVEDQGDNKVTFNCEGPSHPAWDSVNGYVQNPAYVILYLLMNNQKNGGLEIPASEIDLVSFDNMAARFESSGVHYGESGYFIAAERKDASEYLRELCFSFGVALYPAKDGRLTIGKLDLSSYAPGIRIFEQIDALEEPRRPMNMGRIINSIKMRYTYFPSNQTYYGSKIKDNPASIADFEMTAESQEEWDFPWIGWSVLADPGVMADERAEFELARLSYGNRQIIFPLHISWLESLDLLGTFIYQEPFGIDIAGAITEGLFYIEHLDIDPENFSVTITGVDLDWLLNMV